MTDHDLVSMAMGTDKLGIREKYYQKLSLSEAIILAKIDEDTAAHHAHMDVEDLEEWKTNGTWISMEGLLRLNIKGWSDEDYLTCIQQLVTQSFVEVHDNPLKPRRPFVRLNTLHIWEVLLDG